jgi:hypothetical protein
MVKLHGIPHAAFVSGGVVIMIGLLHLIQFINKYSAEK